MCATAAGRAGATTDIFAPGALNEVFRLSQGVPRVINVICDQRAPARSLPRSTGTALTATPGCANGRRRGVWPAASRRTGCRGRWSAGHRGAAHHRPTVGVVGTCKPWSTRSGAARLPRADPAVAAAASCPPRGPAVTAAGPPPHLGELPRAARRRDGHRERIRAGLLGLWGARYQPNGTRFRAARRRNRAWSVSPSGGFLRPSCVCTNPPRPSCC